MVVASFPGFPWLQFLTACSTNWIQERPENEASRERPGNEASRERPENEASRERPGNEASRERPENKASQERPGNEASQDLLVSGLSYCWIHFPLLTLVLMFSF